MNWTLPALVLCLSFSLEAAVKREFWPNGKLKKRVIESPGTQKITTYYENGQAAHYHELKNGKYNGLVIDYDSNGNLINSETYQAGNLSGKSYYQKFTEEGESKGDVEEFYEKGVLRRRIEKNNDGKVMKDFKYLPNGELDN